MIFKNEDDMYKILQSIDLFEDCYTVILEEIQKFTVLVNQNRKKEIEDYRFPARKLRPMIYYMEEKYRFILEKLIENTQFDLPTFNILKSGFEGKLVVLQNYRIEHNEQFKDIYRKNFGKSLDHRSFQYKDFIKKFLTKQVLLSGLKQIAWSNQINRIREPNLLKGGNFKDSPFYHTVGQFSKYSNGAFAEIVEKGDFPIDMNYPNFEEVAKSNL